MVWEEIRRSCPDQWLVIEALEARTICGNQRQLDRLAIVESCSDGPSAMRQYRSLHREYPHRELYFVHTSREALDIREQRWLGGRRGTYESSDDVRNPRPEHNFAVYPLLNPSGSLDYKGLRETSYFQNKLLTLKDNLPFTTVTVVYRGAAVDIPDVLVDTGSATTILSADVVFPIEIVPSPQDTLYIIRGVGGSEVAFSRLVDHLYVGTRKVSDFEIEVGGMDYGFEINGILGMDFLMHVGAIIDLGQMSIEFVEDSS